ncbi:recombinase family protein [Bacillus wiedmannii]|uniref:recombinase family protein n=1 Tax=Bacillus wiedmannii TaxID=1890302 RepID=UPI000BF21E51|nr:recombinase family protein [Bacillus wiedmannii]PEJ48441.1 recombinase [Bacillus wiedmannii]PEM10273.1 recombinase [Bacillus wiedmannii]PGD08275.1 recombinase [Bacillus wiedmannii]PHD09543.1 recombinase [Bacillus wiedmannii]
MKIGYARVSTKKQNLDRQIDRLNEAGCDVIYMEKMTGTKRERPELNRMLEELNEGDTVVFAELARASRSTKDLLEIVDTISKKGANVLSLKESWLDTTSAAGKFMLTVFAGLAEFERDLISERTIEGLESAERRGNVGGRPKHKNDQLDYAIELAEKGELTKSEICRKTGVSRTTLYRRLQEMGIE